MSHPQTLSTSVHKQLAVDRLSFLKVLFHFEKLHECLSNGDTYPVSLSVGFTDYCNHNCLWCYTAYSTHSHSVKRGGPPSGRIRDDRQIDPAVLLRFLDQGRERGLRSVTVVGSGEPMLHPQSADMLSAIASMGLDFGVFTNGQRMSDQHVEVLAARATFVRFSIDAAEPEVYKRLHGIHADFEQTVENMRRLLRHRAQLGRVFPTVGAQFVMSQLNADHVVPFTRQMRDLGVDYVAFKPMYSNPLNPERAKNTLLVEEALDHLCRASELETDSFAVYSKNGDQFQSAWRPAEHNDALYYGRCVAHPFSTPVYANGNVYLCLNLAGHDEFLLGNIYANSLEEIWHSKRRKDAIAAINLHGTCPAGCKLDPLNRIMWDMTHPDPSVHPNFI